MTKLNNEKNQLILKAKDLINQQKFQLKENEKKENEKKENENLAIVWVNLTYLKKSLFSNDEK